MASESPGYEERTRVVCHLPLNDSKEHDAVDAVFSFLESLRTKPLGVKGYTHSAARPPAHFGAWWSATRRRWVREKVVLCFVDYKVPFGGQALNQVLSELRREISSIYHRYTGKEQEELWIIPHPVVR